MKLRNLLFVVPLLFVACTPTRPPLGPGYLNTEPRNSVPVDDATAKLFAPVEGMAVVYIYMPEKSIVAPYAFSVVINNKYVAPIKTESFLRIVLASGNYIIRSGWKKVFGECNIVVESGQVYFLKNTYDLPIALFQAEPNEAKSEILKLKLIDNPYNR